MQLLLAAIIALHSTTSIAAKGPSSNSRDYNNAHSHDDIKDVTVNFCAHYKGTDIPASNVTVECWDEAKYPKCLPHNIIGEGLTGSDGCITFENEKDWEFADGKVGCGKRKLDVFCRVYGSCIQGGLHKTKSYHNKYPDYSVEISAKLSPNRLGLESCTAIPSSLSIKKEIEPKHEIIEDLIFEEEEEEEDEDKITESEEYPKGKGDKEEKDEDKGKDDDKEEKDSTERTNSQEHPKDKIEKVDLVGEKNVANIAYCAQINNTWSSLDTPTQTPTIQPTHDMAIDLANDSITQPFPDLDVRCWSKCSNGHRRFIDMGVTGSDGCVSLEKEFYEKNADLCEGELDISCKVRGKCLRKGIHFTDIFHANQTNYTVSILETLPPARKRACSDVLGIGGAMNESFFVDENDFEDLEEFNDDFDEKILDAPTLMPSSAPQPNPLDYEGPKCTDQLRNGDLEADDTVPFNWSNESLAFGKKSYAMQTLLEMDIVPGENNVGNALHVHNRFTWWASPQLDIDPSCFKVGDQLEFSARIKLEGEDGGPTECIPGQVWGKFGITDGSCPVMTLEIKSKKGKKVDYIDVAQLVAPYSKGWNSMYGVYTVSEEFLNADKITLKWYKYLKEYGFTLDNVSIKDAPDGCEELIKNGGGEKGDLRGWQFYGSNGVVHALEHNDFSIGRNHLASKKRKKYDDGIMTILDTNCLNTTAFYKISAKFKLTKPIDESKSALENCDYLGTSTSGSDIPRCPMVSLGARNEVGASQNRPIASLDIPYENDVKGWNTMSSIFQFFPNEISAAETFIYISGSPPGTNILIDDVKLVKYEL